MIPNPWDAGSARILAGLGFQALATSSGASAGVLGRRDGKVTREEALTLARAIVVATDLPVSADLEKGFGDAPAIVAETIRLAAEAGLVSGSIEDATGDKNKPSDNIGHATERVEAAAQAARALPFSIHLDRPHGEFLARQPGSRGHDQAFTGVRESGGGCAVCAGLARSRLCARSAPQYRNRSTSWSASEASHSLSPSRGGRRKADHPVTSLYHAAMSSLLEAAREVKEKGTFGYLDRSLPASELDGFMRS